MGVKRGSRERLSGSSLIRVDKALGMPESRAGFHGEKGWSQLHAKSQLRG